MLSKKDVWRAGKGTIRASQNFKCDLILGRILKYKNIIKTNQNLIKNIFYSKDNLLKINGSAYVINLDQYKSIKKFMGNRNITTNIYRIQVYNSIMCRYFCIVFIDLMLKVTSLLDYINFFSPNKHESNNKIILKYFQQLNRLKWKKSIALGVKNIKNIKILKYHIFSIKHLRKKNKLKFRKLFD